MLQSNFLPPLPNSNFLDSWNLHVKIRLLLLLEMVHSITPTIQIWPILSILAIACTLKWAIFEKIKSINFFTKLEKRRAHQIYFWPNSSYLWGPTRIWTPQEYYFCCWHGTEHWSKKLLISNFFWFGQKTLNWPLAVLTGYTTGYDGS